MSDVEMYLEFFGKWDNIFGGVSTVIKIVH
jgi:hypothetical protein